MNPHPTLFQETASRRHSVVLVRALAALGLALFLSLDTACSGAALKPNTYKLELAPGEERHMAEQVTLDESVVGEISGFADFQGKRVGIVMPKSRAARLQFRAGLERRSASSLELSAASVADDAPLLAPDSIIPLRNTAENALKESLAGIRELWERNPAMFLVGCAAGLVVLGLLLRLLRAGFTVVLLIVIAVMIFSCCAAKAAPTRPEVERDLKKADAFVAEAENHASEARRLVKAGLARQAQEAGIRAYLACERAAAERSINEPKVMQLSGFSVGLDAKKALLARYEQGAQRRTSVEDHLAELAASAAQPEERLVAMYLRQRDIIRDRVRAERAEGKFVEDRYVIEQLSQLARMPACLVDREELTLNNVGRCRWEAEKLILPNGTVFPPVTNAPPAATSSKDHRLDDLQATTAAIREELKQLKQQASAKVPVIVTNMVTTITNVTTNVTVSPMVMMMSASPATNSVALSEPPQAAEHPPVAESLAKAPPAPADAANKSTAPETPAPVGQPEVSKEQELTPVPVAPAPSAAANVEGPAPAPTKPAEAALPVESVRAAAKPSIMAFAVAAGFAILVVFGVLAWMSMVRGRLYQVILANESSQVESFELAAFDDALLLRKPVIRDHVSSSDPAPRIVVGLRGAVLKPGRAGSVGVNGVALKQPRLLHPGDRLSMEAEGGGTTSSSFLGCEPIVPQAAEA